MPRATQTVVLHRVPTARELAQLREQYVALAKLHPPEHSASDAGAQVANAFVDHINAAVRR